MFWAYIRVRSVNNSFVQDNWYVLVRGTRLDEHYTCHVFQSSRFRARIYRTQQHYSNCARMVKRIVYVPCSVFFFCLTYSVPVICKLTSPATLVMARTPECAAVYACARTAGTGRRNRRRSPSLPFHARTAGRV